jgi:heme A synthase
MSGMAIIMYIMHVNIYITSVHEYIKIIYLFVFYLIVLYRNSERTHYLAVVA